jgi:hypothetical protein
MIVENEMERTMKCPNCNGSGFTKDLSPCNACQNTGEHMAQERAISPKAEDLFPLLKALATEIAELRADMGKLMKSNPVDEEKLKSSNQNLPLNLGWPEPDYPPKKGIAGYYTGADMRTPEERKKCGE